MSHICISSRPGKRASESNQALRSENTMGMNQSVTEDGEKREAGASNQSKTSGITRRHTDIPEPKGTQRIPERVGRVEHEPLESQGTSRSDVQKSSGTVPVRLSKHSDQRPAAPITPSSFENCQEPLKAEGLNISGLSKLSDKIDVISSSLSDIRRALNVQREDEREKRIVEERLREVQNKLQQATVSSDMYRKNWKKAATELGQLRSQGSSLNQVTDDDLITRVEGLRYDIRTFSIQYFTVKSSKQAKDFPVGDFSVYLRQAVSRSGNFEDCIGSATSGPIMIEAFLWRVLVHEVFGRFCWIPCLRESMLALCRALGSGVPHDEAGQEQMTRLESEHKFQIWKATTSTLISDSVEFIDTRKVQKSIDGFNKDFSRAVFDVMHSFVSGPQSEILDAIKEIIETSVALDQDICKQAAKVDWWFPHSEEPILYNPDCMAVIVGAEEPHPGQSVDLVVAPALRKRGRSNGEDFEMENLLLGMNVACIAMPLEPSKRRRYI